MNPDDDDTFASRCNILLISFPHSTGSSIVEIWLSDNTDINECDMFHQVMRFWPMWKVSLNLLLRMWHSENFNFMTASMECSDAYATKGYQLDPSGGNYSADSNNYSITTIVVLYYMEIVRMWVHGCCNSCILQVSLRNPNCMGVDKRMREPHIPASMEPSIK